MNSLDSLCFFLPFGVIGRTNVLGLNVPSLPSLLDERGARFGLGVLTEL